MISQPLDESILSAENSESLLPKLGVYDRRRNPVMIVPTWPGFLAFLASVEHYQAAPHSKGSADLVDHQFRSGEFVIRVRDENGVDYASRQVRIVRFPHTAANIVNSSRKCSDPKEGQRQFTNIDCEHSTGSTDSPRQLQ